MEDFPINIDVRQRLCPSFKVWLHYVSEFDTPALAHKKLDHE